MKASVICETWKRPSFERHLTAAGYQYEEQGAPVDGTIHLIVTFDNVDSLAAVVLAAQTECNVNDNAI